MIFVLVVNVNACVNRSVPMAGKSGKCTAQDRNVDLGRCKLANLIMYFEPRIIQDILNYRRIQQRAIGMRMSFVQMEG